MNELFDVNTLISIVKVEKLITRCRTLRNFSLSALKLKWLTQSPERFRGDSVTILALVPNPFGVAEKKISW